ncbi:hypothetical protein AM593_03885, partial [Mytilus galloprovincialis]
MALTDDAVVDTATTMWAVSILDGPAIGCDLGCIGRSDVSARSGFVTIRAPSTSTPTPTITPTCSEVNSQMIPENHRLSCSDNETKTVACLNGGSCFAVYVEDRTVQCACYSKYIGRRCEMIDPEIIFDDKENLLATNIQQPEPAKQPKEELQELD